MPQLLDFITSQLSSEHVDRIASQLGASREQTESAIGMALPTLLGAMARKADDDAGASELHKELEKHDGSILDNLGSLLGGDASGSAPSGASGLLGSLLGQRQNRVESGIGKASGLDGTQVSSMMSMLAPLIMGAVAKKSGGASSGGGLDLGSLTSMLRTEKKSMETQATGGFLAGLLDQDGDGDFDLQDIMKLGMNRLFGKK